MNQNDASSRTGDDFRKLWAVFQRRALQKLVDANEGKELPVVLWTSGLTARGKVRYSRFCFHFPLQSEPAPKKDDS